MDLKLVASFSLICILVHCCHICEGRPRPRNCFGLVKDPRCPMSNIGIVKKRIIDEILKSPEDDNGEWEQELITEEKQPEYREEQLFGDRAPANGWEDMNDDTQALYDTREKEIEELRTKELKLLLIRAMLDDLENETFEDM